MCKYPFFSKKKGYFFLLYLRNILCTKNVYCHTCYALLCACITCLKYLLCPVSTLHILFFFYISVQKRYGTYNSTLCVINYYCPFGLPPLFDKTVGEPVFIISREVFYTTLKLFQPPAEQVVYLFSKVPFFGSAKNSSMENRAMP